MAHDGSELAKRSELADTFASMTASEWAAFFITEIHLAKRPIAWFKPSHRWKPRSTSHAGPHQSRNAAESRVFSQAPGRSLGFRQDLHRLEVLAGSSASAAKRWFPLA